MTTTASIPRANAEELYTFCQKHKLKEFFFAKDSGAYFGATAGSNKDGTFENSIHYLKGMDPHKTEKENKGDWYENAREKFGGDDFGIEMPTEWLKLFCTSKALASKRMLSIRIKARSVELII